MDKDKKYLKAYGNIKESQYGEYISVALYRDNLDELFIKTKSGKEVIYFNMYKKKKKDDYGDYKFVLPQQQDKTYVKEDNKQEDIDVNDLPF